MPENFQPERRLIITEDGSHTFALEGVKEHYHSTFGAMQESRHVFIENGFNKMLSANETLRILEVGFGTGLNALLTYLEALKVGASVVYHAIEPYPLKPIEYKALNYPKLIGDAEAEEFFLQLHESGYNKEVAIAPQFLLRKYPVTLNEAKWPSKHFDLVYYDAFGPEVQPEMWELTAFKKVFTALRLGGVLTTYCSKGGVRRGLKSAGFYVSKMPGPQGKREITHAKKLR